MSNSPSSLPPTPSIIPSLPSSSRAQILDLLFEPCEGLHKLSVELLGSETFDSYTALITAVGRQLRELQRSQLWSDGTLLHGILNAHPRLGEKKVGALSEASRKEQEAMMKNASGGGGSAGESEEVAERLRMLNDEYESSFQGMKYVVFVNGRSRPVIMEDMERRIKRGDIDLEKEEAIQAMCDIAIDRAKKMGGS